MAGYYAVQCLRVYSRSDFDADDHILRSRTMAHLNYLKRKRESGQTIVLFSMAIVPLLGMVGLVVDVSWAYFRRHSAQAAADAAAVAAAMAVQTSSPSEVDCGKNGVWCH